MERIRAVTWNVWWRFGGNWRERQPGIAEILRRADPDLVGLQECWGDSGSHTTQSARGRRRNELGA